jgi:hypothetical protein
MKLFILIFLILSTSCHMQFIAGSFDDPDLPISYDFATLEEAWTYVARNINYKHDTDDEYWQTPSETYTLKTGDCEDKAILLMHLMDRLGISTELAAIGYLTGTVPIHALIKSKGMLLEPAVPNYYPSEGIKVYELYSYKDTIKRCNANLWF